ncbi:L-selectin CD62 antigen-like family member L [Takifugu flavidus]|uniref:L-selectin CD62 antigen-like family member L n=1 Tax=Takifugu flavidus TaxID=433684 RepID=A0A5C6NEV8_9TELE|nr:L-selectin CD62 antigen-like family member L [Takifugu flavidus]
MAKALLLALSLSGLTFRSAGVVRKYHYVDTALSWEDARTHCKAKFANLATVTKQEDADGLLQALPSTGSYAWIGLHDDLTKLSWSMTNVSFNNHRNYSNWEMEKIDNISSRDRCILMKTSGTWQDRSCEEEQLLVCYDEESPNTYVFVNKSMNWRDAKTFCRAHHTDLAFVRNSSENGRIAALLPADAWIGLFRVSWKKWSDQERVSFTDWGEGQPDSKANASCGAADAATATWWDDDCSLKRPFVCYTIQKTQKARVKLKFLSEADLMDPAVHQQLLEQHWAPAHVLAAEKKGAGIKSAALSHFLLLVHTF